MASTNKTTHYDLSQYIATDKPTYLVDYNGDMSKIDTAIYEADSLAKVNEGAIGDLTNLTTTAKNNLVSAINEVDDETSKIGNLSNLTTTANTDLVSAINEVDSEADTNTSAIGTLANLDTSVKTNLVGAINEVNSNIGTLSSLSTTDKSDVVSAINETRNSFDVTVTKSYSGTTDISGTNATITGSDVKIAMSTNEDLGKIYGYVNFTAGYSSVGITLTNDGIDTDTTYGINCLVAWRDVNDNKIVDITTLNVGDNNSLYTVCANCVTGHTYTMYILPCLLYFKSFGDTPVTP